MLHTHVHVLRLPRQRVYVRTSCVTSLPPGVYMGMKRDTAGTSTARSRPHPPSMFTPSVNKLPSLDSGSDKH
eukprot:984290-Amphidinium_carterae.1